MSIQRTSIVRDASPTTNKAVEVTIEKLVYGGDGLARLDGQVLLVPFVLPGERVTVTPQRVKNGVLRGSRPQIVQQAEQRVIPGCEYFYNCGGCQYQHASYEFQLAQKQSILRETLQRLGGIAYSREIPIISAHPWEYRNRIQLHFADRRVGFHQAGSHQLCPIDHCPISSPMLADAVAKLNSAVKAPQWPAFLRSMELFTNEQHLQLTITDTTRPVAARFFEWCGTFLPALAPRAIDYQAAGHNFRISCGSFFQVNRFLIDALVQDAIGAHTGTQAIDLYAGVGLFSLPLTARFERVIAVERGAVAYRDLEWNAQHTPDLECRKVSAEEFLRGITDTPDLIVADPPRAGLDRDVTAELLRILPPSLVIVSCDPATLGRDLKKLLTAYEIEHLTLVDLFPQTYHFETVVRLRRQ